MTAAVEHSKSDHSTLAGTPQTVYPTLEDENTSLLQAPETFSGNGTRRSHMVAMPRGTAVSIGNHSEGGDLEEGAPQQTMTMWSCAINLSKLAFGLSLLFVPSNAYTCGYIGFPLLITAVAFFDMITTDAFTQAMELAETDAAAKGKKILFVKKSKKIKKLFTFHLIIIII